VSFHDLFDGKLVAQYDVTVYLMLSSMPAMISVQLTTVYSMLASMPAQCDNLCNNIKQNRSIRNIVNVNMQLADCRSFAKLTCNWMLHRPSMFMSVLNSNTA
jgi:hypothetical protein